jgi:3-isopropylmalate dehydrogenase
MKLELALLPGDGVGPEVASEAMKVLEEVARSFGHDVDAIEKPFGGQAIHRTGECFPQETRDACLNRQAIFLGAVGDPAFDHLPPQERPEGAILGLRKELGSFANLRPVVAQYNPSYSLFRDEALRGVDILFVRELTGGLYFGQPRGIREEEGQLRAWNTLVYTAEEVERIARIAFEAAQIRKKRVTSVDKANVLEVSRMWRQIVDEMASEYPDVELGHMYVDRAAMEIISKPSQFDVILTTNMFGDILSDEASILAGSLGLLPSASLGGRVGLYEPVHGSAPDIAGKGIANPLGAIASMAMMLRYSFKLEEEARAVEEACQLALDKGYLTADLVGPQEAKSTKEVGDFIAKAVGSLG